MKISELTADQRRQYIDTLEIAKREAERRSSQIRKSINGHQAEIAELQRQLDMQETRVADADSSLQLLRER